MNDSLRKTDYRPLPLQTRNFMCASILTAPLLLSACLGSAPGTQAARPSAIARPLEVYQQLGFLAGPPDFPAVAGFTTMAGPSDSTFVLVGVSLPASALRFQREAGGFRGEYQVEVAFLIRDSVVIRRVERKENVRVTSFAETSRVDESIIFQDMVALLPGRYIVQVNARDALSRRGFQARDTVDVPAYGEQRRMTASLLVYEAEGREDRATRPDFIVNTRRTVPYGAAAPRVYMELYDAPTPQEVQLRIVDDRGAAVWQEQALVEAGNERLRHATIDIPTGGLPVGRLWLEVSTAGAEVQRSPLLITISEQWMVANFDQVLRFMAYIAHPAELDSLKASSEAARRERWEAFWRQRDPLPATPINEFREEFFQRVRFVSEHFVEPGRPGWDTARGQVYVVLGAPDEITDRRVGGPDGTQVAGIEWLYRNRGGLRVQLLFVEQAGSGQYELAPQSENTFRNAALRLRPRAATR